MNISDRLLRVSEMVQKCGTVADIGCDHGYVTIYLLKNGIAERALSADVNKGPLEACEKNLRLEHVSDRAKVLLSDGFKAFDAKEKIDAAVIAGMGGRLMKRILTEGEAIVKNVSQLVLQPQSEIFLIREWVRENNFHIEREEILKEDGKYYFILDVRRGSEKEEFREVYDSFSKYLIEKKDPLLIEYLRRGLNNNLKYLQGIEESRQGRLLHENALINEALSMME